MAENRSQRRLATILAADVVGYSRLMEADESGTLAALKSRRRDLLDPLVTKHQGRVFKTTGDGVLVEFASAVNAVQCAVDLQQTFADANKDIPDGRQIVLRIGVNLGDVIVEGGDLYGDGVNIAARLEALAEPGSILVSGTAYDHIKSKVKIGFSDIGTQNLKNIVEPVRAYQIKDTPAAPGITTLSVSDKPSIAVLPFTNLSDDPAQDYFSDGLAEDIATELGRFRNLLVISQNSSLVFKGGAVDTKEVARRLGARYIVEGSVRRSGNRMRIAARLLESATGNHLWAERYDRDVDDLFDVQDEITRMIATNLPLHIEKTESARILHRTRDNLSAYDHWLRGKHLMSGDLSKENVLRARLHLERAVEIDPHFGSAYVELAICRWNEYKLSQSTSRETAVEEVLELSHRAVEADPRDSRTHLSLAWGYFHAKGDFDLAKVQVEEALALNPNDYYNYCLSGWLAACTGDLEHALACSNEALQRSPVIADGCLETRAVAEYLAGNYSASISAFGKMLRPSEFMHGWVAAAYAQLGHMDEAHAMADAFLKRTRNSPLMPKGNDLVEWHRYWDIEFQTKDPAAREQLFDGLRKAGLPA